MEGKYLGIKWKRYRKNIASCGLFRTFAGELKGYYIEDI